VQLKICLVDQTMLSQTQIETNKCEQNTAKCEILERGKINEQYLEDFDFILLSWRYYWESKGMLLCTL